MNDSSINLVVKTGAIVPIILELQALGKEIQRSNYLAVLCHNFATVDHEVSPTAHTLLSLPGLRPGFQEMLQ